MSVDLKKIAAAFPEFQLSSKSRHDGAQLLQLQAADGRYVARTIPSPQLSAPPETEWLIRSIRRELAVPGMEMATASR
ncbi:MULTISPECIES: DUF3509 domain-containing protein [Pseudomonas aeruginosa group]|uniref:DUF3509 domain-containing protein n=3 Tax=Pseudomonas aeruginosa group TaxID=136841 RepID=A0ABD7JYG2_PSEAI|nr:MULTISPECIES: DUF3509 domain-containing protein [Pseudomonas aeruginosa group]KFF35661.1 hypothetical protein G039_0310520 [Pseudomonas aeruginosa VRFPA01]VTS23225.1 Protein of uncharacterised function (DUF3509) [Streptococcus dysgalactiae subsp. equisimilis]ABR85318.1 hypothetical protein PSPA7_2490 [Pseudomonas aeruginosa PA7]AVK08185.1 hypothetical protein CSB93_3762 [Pseudomonas paraeruginosa]AVR67542.1 DUF3509 domain-containing protein [Pseudomonas paraeruginosa]